MRDAERGHTVRGDVCLAGIGLSVVGGLQDELFNLTIDRISVQAVSARLEASVSGTIQVLGCSREPSSYL